MRMKKEFLYFSTYVIFVSILIILISFFYTTYVWINQQKEIKNELFIEASHIEEILKEIFEETTQLMTVVGKQIIGLQDHGKDNLKDIELLLSKTPEAVYHIGKTVEEKYKVGKTSRVTYYGKIKKFPSWRNFGWIPLHNLLVISPHFGLPPKTIDMSFRKYIPEGQKTPWILRFSPPDIGLPSGLWEIPAGMGITNKEGKYLGTVSVGFTISELNEVLQQKVSQDHISYIVLDESYKIVLQSLGNSWDLKSAYYRTAENKESLFYGTHGNLTTPIAHKGVTYSYFQRMQNYPYIILMGYRDDWIYKVLFEVVFPRLIEFTGLGILCLILLYAFRKHILNIAKSSEKEKDKFLSHMKSKILPFPLYSENLSFPVFNAETLNFSYIDVDKIIKECIVIHSHKAFLKNIKIIKDPSFKKLTHNPYVDEFFFKQIIVSLLSLSFNFLEERGIIVLSCELKKELDKKFLYIYIKDNGIPLDKITLVRLQRNYNNQTFDFYGQAEFSFERIEELVNLQGGSCDLEIKGITGKVIRLIFPCQKGEEVSSLSKILESTETNKGYLH